MAKAFPSHALVLIDLHGETSVVQTVKLSPPSRIKVASRPNLRIGQQVLLVEILALSDSQVQLKETEHRFPSTHRGLAIEKEIQERDESNSAIEGGFLDIWPADQENQPVRNAPAAKKKVSTTQRKRNQTAKTTPAAKRPRTLTTAKQPRTLATVNQTSRFPYDLQGSNGRKINVLYEGSGDYASERQLPKRQPVFLDGLTTDQQDLVNLQMTSHATNKVNQGTQTDAVVIISSDDEAVKWVEYLKNRQQPPTPPPAVQPPTPPPAVQPPTPPAVQPPTPPPVDQPPTPPAVQPPPPAVQAPTPHEVQPPPPAVQPPPPAVQPPPPAVQPPTPPAVQPPTPAAVQPPTPPPAVQPPTPPPAVQPPTPPPAVQPPTPPAVQPPTPAAVQPPTPPPAVQPPTPPAVQPPTPAAVQPPTPPPAVQPPTPPPAVQPPTPPPAVQPPTPPPAVQPPTPPAVQPPTPAAVQPPTPPPAVQPPTSPPAVQPTTPPTVAQPLAPRAAAQPRTSPHVPTPTSDQFDKIQKQLEHIISLLQPAEIKAISRRQSVDFIASLLQDNNLLLSEFTQPDPENNQPAITNFYLPAAPPNQASSVILPAMPSQPTSDISAPSTSSASNPPSSTATSHLPAPTIPVLPNPLARTLNPCAKGAIIEISSYLDVSPIPDTADHELRINNRKMWDVKEDSCSCSNFGWNLARNLYMTEEMTERNYKGVRGKLPLSPRRRHAIEHAVSDVYGPECIPQAIAAWAGRRRKC